MNVTCSKSSSTRGESFTRGPRSASPSWSAVDASTSPTAVTTVCPSRSSASTRSSMMFRSRYGVWSRGAPHRLLLRRGRPTRTRVAAGPQYPSTAVGSRSTRGSGAGEGVLHGRVDVEGLFDAQDREDPHHLAARRHEGQTASVRLGPAVLVQQGARARRVDEGDLGEIYEDAAVALGEGLTDGLTQAGDVGHIELTDSFEDGVAGVLLGTPAQLHRNSFPSVSSAGRRRGHRRGCSDMLEGLPRPTRPIQRCATDIRYRTDVRMCDILRAWQAAWGDPVASRCRAASGSPRDHSTTARRGTAGSPTPSTARASSAPGCLSSGARPLRAGKGGCSTSRGCVRAGGPWWRSGSRRRC